MTGKGDNQGPFKRVTQNDTCRRRGWGVVSWEDKVHQRDKEEEANAKCPLEDTYFPKTCPDF